MQWQEAIRISCVFSFPFSLFISHLIIPVFVSCCHFKRYRWFALHMFATTTILIKNSSICHAMQHSVRLMNVVFLCVVCLCVSNRCLVQNFIYAWPKKVVCLCFVFIYGVAPGLIGVLKSILHSSPSPLHNRICWDRSSLFFILPRIRRIRGSIQPFWNRHKKCCNFTKQWIHSYRINRGRKPPQKEWNVWCVPWPVQLQLRHLQHCPPS